MADVNKSIEISYRADVKQLEKTLRESGKLSEQQIKEMIGGLNKQLRQTEKAAKQAATGTQKAMKQIDAAAKQSTINARSLRREFANIDRLTSEASQGLALFSPALGDAAMQASVAASGVESLGRALSVSNPLFIIGAVVVGGLIAAFTHAEEQAKMLKESEERLNQELEKSQKEFENLAKSVVDADRQMGSFITSTNQLRNDLLVARGDISQVELQSIQNAQDLYDFEQQLKNTAQDKLNILHEQSKNYTSQEHAVRNEIKLLEDSKSLIFSNAKINKQILDLKTKERELMKASGNVNLEIYEHERDIREEITRQVRERKAVLDAMQEQREEEERIRKAEERRRKAQERAREAEKQRQDDLKRLGELQKLLDDAVKSEEMSVKSIEQIQAKRIGKEAEIALNYKLQVDSITEAKTKLEEQLVAAQELAKTDQDRQKVKELEIQTAETLAILEQEHHIQAVKFREEIADLEEERHKKELDNAEKEKQAKLQNAKGTANAIIDAAVSVAQFNAAMNKEDIKAQQKLFRVNQAASIANITMKAAEQIAAALGLPPIIRGLQIAAITAGSAAQIGVVAAQTPPTADMGGMIGNRDNLRPDETMVRVLSGEAVLDRATVNRIGGQEGLQQLQQGGTMGNVVVVQPFKHFDRFIKQSNRTGVINKSKRVARY
jgi:hypothetical protein